MTANPSAPSALELVIALELEVQTPQCRSDERRIRELLADDFVEIGASSRRWDLASTLEMLREESTDPDVAKIEVLDLEAREISSGVVQVLWTSSRGGRQARRTSIWCLREQRWRLVYHQGTLITA